MYEVHVFARLTCISPRLTHTATPLSGRPLAVLGMNCRHVLLYNLGLQQLYAGHPNAAFDSLLEVVQMYHANPRLWLRLAEACVFSYAKVCLCKCLCVCVWGGGGGGGWKLVCVLYLETSSTLSTNCSHIRNRWL